MNKETKQAARILEAVVIRGLEEAAQSIFHLTQMAAPEPPKGLDARDSYIAGYFDGVRASMRVAQISIMKEEFIDATKP